MRKKHKLYLIKNRNKIEKKIQIQLVNIKIAYFQHYLYLFDIFLSFIRFRAFQSVEFNCYCNYEK